MQSTITEYKRTNEQASQNNTSVSDIPHATIAKRRRSRGESGAGEEESDPKRARCDPDAITLRRDQSVFSERTLRLKQRVVPV